MIKNIRDLNIILLDINKDMVRAWDSLFARCNNIRVIHSSLQDYIADNPDIKCVVSPANAFGQMTGGFDLAISGIFGWELQDKVKEELLIKFYGEQPIGSSICIDIPGWDAKLIHTPTMRTPSRIKDSEIIYTCMRSTLICAMENLNPGDTIIIPAFGALCGGIDKELVAEEMYDAYATIAKPCLTKEDIYYRYLTGGRL